MTYGFTGHRPPRLGGYGKEARQKLYNFAHKVVRIHLNTELHVKGNPIKTPDKAIVGMAQGWDMAVAQACEVLGVPFIAAVPFPGQESVWPDPEVRALYQSLLGAAERVVYIHTVQVSYARMGEVAKLLQLRNQWMVDHSDKMIALYEQDKQELDVKHRIRGGTYNCIKYAERQKKEVINVWEDWEAFQ